MKYLGGPASEARSARRGPESGRGDLRSQGGEELGGVRRPGQRAVPGVAPRGPLRLVRRIGTGIPGMAPERGRMRAWRAAMDIHLYTPIREHPRSDLQQRRSLCGRRDRKWCRGL